MIGIRETAVVIRGGGDLASGTAHRLFRCGFPVVILELPKPLCIRRAVSFAEAVYEKEWTVEGVTARLVESPLSPPWPFIPILVDPAGEMIQMLRPTVVVDARMAKQNLGTTRDDARLVIGLGPGFTASADVHLVVETQRGHSLGRVIDRGSAAPDTGVPGELGGEGARRVLRSPRAGTFVAKRAIGDQVRPGDLVGEVGDEPVIAQIGGTVRGVLRSGLHVPAGIKVADVDPRPDVDVRGISDKARAVAGGVLEAILSRLAASSAPPRSPLAG